MRKEENLGQKRDLFSREYKSFLSQCKTERECIKFFSAQLEQHGFKRLNDFIACNTPLKEGDKVYAVNMNKALVAFKIGSAPMHEGLNIIAAHIDSPRLDLKSKPVYSDGGFCIFDTHYYGGIKKYQWTATPLALHGLVCKKDGTKIDWVVGESEKDPLFVVTDLLPHLDDKKPPTMTGEQLNLIVSKKEKDESPKETIDDLLCDFGFQSEDLMSAEI